MLKKCSSARLLSDVPSFAEIYRNIAESMDVVFVSDSDWNIRYRVSEDVLIFGTKYFDKVNPVYYPKSVILLKEGESPVQYMMKGIEHFIFNFKDSRELAMAFYHADRLMVHSFSAPLKEILEDTRVTQFICGDYDFRFEQNEFRWKGKLIYVPEATKRYLAEWLLHGNKDNSKRQMLYNMRKHFGNDFLSDIDRHGQIKEKENEQ